MCNTMKQCLHCKENKKVQPRGYGDKYIEDKHIEFYAEFLEFGVNVPLLNKYFPDITLDSYQRDFKNNICPFCKHKLIDTLITGVDFYDIVEYSDCNKDFLLAMVELRKNDVIEYEMKMNAIKRSLVEQYRQQLERKQNYQMQKSQVKCPKCGSTSIATVNRGYGLISGFFGSGSPRNVCQKCGHKWKPKR